MSGKEKRVVVSLPEAKEILERIDFEKADQIQKRTLDYSIKFSKTDAQKARKIRKALVRECGLTEEEAAEVTNIMPTRIEELRVFSAGWRKLLPTETLEKMLEILST